MRKTLSVFKWSVFSIAVAAAVLFTWFSWSSDPGTDYRIRAGVACQTAIKENLKDPSSAKFVDRLNWPASLDGDMWTIEATYRGANSLGGVVTETVTCKAQQGSFHATLIR